MKFFPYDSFIIKTRLSPEDIQQILHDNVEPNGWFQLRWNVQKPYGGKIDERKFSISRIIRYRNSFLPIIKGEIIPNSGGSIVRIKMRPYGFTIAFMCFWLGGVSYMFLDITGDWFLYITQFQPSEYVSLMGIFIPVAFFIFGYTLLLGGYKFEATKSRNFLYEKLISSEYTDELVYEDKLFGFSSIQIAILLLLVALCFVSISILIKVFFQI
jgi:hypothetical protein